MGESWDLGTYLSGVVPQHVWLCLLCFQVTVTNCSHSTECLCHYTLLGLRRISYQETGI